MLLRPEVMRPSAIPLFLVLLAGACSHTADRGTVEPSQAEAVVKSARVRALSCSFFEWIAFEGVGPYAAMRIPVGIGGSTYWFQLDTGADGSVLYGSSIAEKNGWLIEGDARFARVESLTLGGMTLPAAQFGIRQNRTPSEQTVGTIGLNFLVGKMVMLDFPQRRFCLAPAFDPPLEFVVGVAFVPAELRDGKLFVNPTVAGRAIEDLFFDTGASAFGVHVDFERWKELTGLSSADQGRAVTVPSWGTEVTIVSADASGSFELGEFVTARPAVSFNADSPVTFAKWPFAVQGLIGNVMFLDSIIVLDLSAQPKFGMRP